MGLSRGQFQYDHRVIEGADFLRKHGLDDLAEYFEGLDVTAEDRAREFRNLSEDTTQRISKLEAERDEYQERFRNQMTAATDIIDENMRLAAVIEKANAADCDACTTYGPCPAHRILDSADTGAALREHDAELLRVAANDVRLVLNGGGHGKAAVWFLLDKAKDIENGTASE